MYLVFGELFDWILGLGFIATLAGNVIDYLVTGIFMVIFAGLILWYILKATLEKVLGISKKKTEGWRMGD